jgi:hypothetical protein
MRHRKYVVRMVVDKAGSGYYLSCWTPLGFTPRKYHSHVKHFGQQTAEQVGPRTTEWTKKKLSLRCSAAIHIILEVISNDYLYYKQCIFHTLCETQMFAQVIVSCNVSLQILNWYKRNSLYVVNTVVTLLAAVCKYTSTSPLLLTSCKTQYVSFLSTGSLSFLELLPWIGA